jgi:hypothetical protein
MTRPQVTPRPPRLDRLALFKDLGYEPHEGQMLVHQSTARRRVLACGSRWGKSLCASMEACAALLEPRERALGWLVAPTRDLVDRIFLRVVDILRAQLGHRVLDLDLRTQRIVVSNLGGGTSELRGKSADMPVTLLGEALDFLIEDEASRLRCEIWESHLSPRLIDRRGWALLLSTPSGPGWFHELYRRGLRRRDPDCESWSQPSWLNPHIDKALVDAERDRLGPEVFAEQYGGEFQGVKPEPCEACYPRSPKACRVLLVEEDEELRRCPECNDPVDGEGRSLVREGTDLMKIIILQGTGERDAPGPQDTSVDAKEAATVSEERLPDSWVLE